MKKQKISMCVKCLSAVCAVAALVAIAQPLRATGIGVYGGAGIGQQEWQKKTGNEWNAAGGLVVDTAVAEDKLFNYRLNLGFGKEYGFRHILKPVPYTFRLMSMSSGTTTMNMYQTQSTFYKSKQQVKPLSINMSHAFGFGVVRTPVVRFWLGPELAITGIFNDKFDMKKLWGVRGGLGLILGLNINPGDLVTLSFTASGRVEYAYRYSKFNKYTISYMTMVIDPPMPLPFSLPPSNPVTKKKAGLPDSGLRFGGYLTFAFLFRVGDTYGGAE